jgi:hypothetical protein
MGKAGLKH